MPDFGLTKDGFVLKRMEDIKLSLEASARLALGQDAVLGADSVEGQMIATFTEAFTVLWEQSNNAYDAFNPNEATERTLEKLCVLTGVRREDDQYSYVDITCTGTPGTVITIDSSAGVESTGVKFYTQEAATIEAGGTVEVRAYAQNAGEITASAGTVNHIYTPISGWDSVTNIEDAVAGQLSEEDEELRTRRTALLAQSAYSTVEALFSSISALQGVTHVLVYENETDIVDSNGLPAHSFSCVVNGGDTDEIGQRIWSRKPTGVLSYGNTSSTVTDIQGFTHTLNIYRPVSVPIHVTVNITSTVTLFPEDAEALITQAIIDYAEGKLIAGAEFNVGDDILNSRLYTPVNIAVHGHTIDSLETSTDGITFDANDVSITPFQIGEFLEANITVVVA